LKKMKVMLLKDVYKLGRAGDVKRVADGYGRNYLIPQGMAVLATAEALKMSERIRVVADKQREVLNQEMGGVAEQINGMLLTFPARASETGRLYGSVTVKMIADAIREKTDIDVSHRQVDSQPLRELGEFTVPIRLTVDLVPAVTVIVYREGETAPTQAGAGIPSGAGAPQGVEAQAEVEAEADVEEVAEAAEELEAGAMEEIMEEVEAGAGAGAEAEAELAEETPADVVDELVEEADEAEESEEAEAA
jgi:large subunit ribosomal protein L9